MTDGRRRYLVAYDIRDPYRLRQVHDVVLNYGSPLQYSVFVCDLSSMERIWLKADLREEMDLVADSVTIIDLGDPAERGTECFDFMGARQELPSPGGPQIL